MLMLKARRLQILVDEDQYRRLEAVAAQRKVPVAVVVREALDDKLPSAPEARRRAFEAILSAPPMAVGSPEELREELEALRDRRG
jgi:hypothetical protein